MPLADGASPSHAIVLAAGASRRFDGAKLLAPLRGRPLVVHAVETALASPVEGVILVIGARAAAVADTLGALPGERLQTVFCKDWDSGLAASLQSGLAALPDDCRAALIYLGDMPDCDPALGGEMLRLVQDGAGAAYPVYHGQPGHPVAVSAELFPKLHALKGDRGARAVLEGTPNLVRIAVDDPGCIRDIDTRDDLTELN